MIVVVKGEKGVAVVTGVIAVFAVLVGPVGVEVVGVDTVSGLRELHVGLGGVVGIECGAVTGCQSVGVLIGWGSVLGGVVGGVSVGCCWGVVVGGVLTVGISHGCVRVLGIFFGWWSFICSLGIY